MYVWEDINSGEDSKICKTKHGKIYMKYDNKKNIINETKRFTEEEFKKYL
jgi:hypothetical protein